MRVAITEQRFNLNLLPDRAKEELSRLDADSLAHLEQEFENYTEQSPSKWAAIVQRAENDPAHLAGYGEQLKKDMLEFRESFMFPHEASS
ncbi:hypothetical protein U14_04400 [Candidatus Moduliflexus flocculans]|uniref:Uncharacterized protein n=1 Tax=Candidatus Moduliflexus flocculans TaxID=1499966 RepID=A0A0S6W430_9BACT|nr:hypothetical protein U14_04400 [Candidatus Moduliflexus flocculans]